jgi:hypothetical protein
MNPLARLLVHNSNANLEKLVHNTMTKSIDHLGLRVKFFSALYKSPSSRWEFS